MKRMETCFVVVVAGGGGPELPHTNGLYSHVKEINLLQAHGAMSIIMGIGEQ